VTRGLEKIDPETRKLLFDAICADPEIRALIISGSTFGPIDEEPVYEPGKSYVSQDIDKARSQAKRISRALAPQIDTSMGDFGALFLEVRFAVTKHLRK
jgi:hypothetical protein